MQFWSKGLGKKTIQLTLSKGECVQSEDELYLQGRMEAPVSWEYIMPMRGVDLVDFFALLRDAEVAAYLHSSPRRWQIYATMIVEGLRLAGLVLIQVLRHATGRLPAAAPVVIQVPPASVLEKKKPKGKKREEEAPERRTYRRRLGSSTLSAPSLSQGMRQPPPEELDADSIDEAIREAMQAAESIGG